MEKTIKPIFLLSQPRSGSTLLQRLLGSHPNIATAPEPWILLPLLSMRNPAIGSARYHWRVSTLAVGQFVEGIPDGETVFNAAIRNFVETLYAEHSGGERYFVDKTPRYGMVVEELIEAFPEAHYLVLWRNPLAVAASLVETFGHGYWCLFRRHIDLVEIPQKLARATEKLQPGQVCEVHYESLLTEPEHQLARIYEWLGLTDEHAVNLADDLDASIADSIVGDRWGRARYPSLSTEPLTKWTATFAGSPLRRAWGRRYIKRLGSDLLRRMGYEPSELIESLRHCRGRPTPKVLVDPLFMALEPIYQRWDARIWWMLDDSIKAQLTKNRERVSSKKRQL